MGGEGRRVGENEAVALTPPAGPQLNPRPQRQCRPAEAGSAGATGSAGVEPPAVPGCYHRQCRVEGTGSAAKPAQSPNNLEIFQSFSVYRLELFL